MNEANNKQELFEAIVARFTRQLRDGKQPRVEEYLEQYPQHADELQDLLVSVELIEGLKLSAGNALPETRHPVGEILQLKQIGDYDIVRELGRGGMGIVLEAVHRSLGRRVAIKVLPANLIRDTNHVARFRREAQAAARLHHTNIVSVFGVGEHQGHHYYVMEFVDGANLSGIVRELARTNPGGADLTAPNRAAETDRRITKPDAGRLTRANHAHGATRGGGNADTRRRESSPQRSEHEPPADLTPRPPFCLPRGKQRFRWAADLCSQVADALAYASAQGMLHRDIKPSNLLLDGDGQVWITDFGLVKEIHRQALTATGDIIGTPQYMCPESFEGQYDERSETYCLGLTLYELVTLQPAFSESSTAELIKSVTASSPPSPRKLDHRIPRDLNTIIEKATARDPQQRYLTAEALRDDLRAFVADRAILARRPSGPEQVWRWARRNPLAASLAGMCLGLLLLVAITAATGYWVASSALVDVRKQAAELRQQKDQIEELLTSSQEKSRAISEGLRKAEASVQITVEMFDEMFKQIVSGSARANELTIDSYRELAGVETAITTDDAEFLRGMLVFYNQFAEQNSNNALIRHDSARVYRRVANVYHLVGDYEQALEAYQRSVDAYDLQLQESAGGISETIDYVQVNNEMAIAMRRLISVDPSRRGPLNPTRLLRSSIELLRLHAKAMNPAIQLELAKTLQLVSADETLYRVFFSTPFGPGRRGPGRGLRDSTVTRFNQDRRRDLEEAASILQGMVVEDGSDPALRLELAKCQFSLAGYLVANQDPRGGELLQSVTEELERLYQGQPENPEFGFYLAVVYSVQRPQEQGKPEELLDQAIDILEALTTKHPRIVEYQQFFVLALLKRTLMHGRRRDFSAAQLTLAQAQSVMDQFQSRPDSQSRFQRSLAHRLEEIESIIADASERPASFVQRLQQFRRPPPGPRDRGPDRQNRPPPR